MTIRALDNAPKMEEAQLRWSADVYAFATSIVMTAADLGSCFVIVDTKSHAGMLFSGWYVTIVAGVAV